jgi:hypothetical protein
MAYATKETGNSNTSENKTAGLLLDLHPEASRFYNQRIKEIVLLYFNILLFKL